MQLKYQEYGWITAKRLLRLLHRPTNFPSRADYVTVGLGELFDDLAAVLRAASDSADDDCRHVFAFMTKWAPTFHADTIYIKLLPQLIAERDSLPPLPDRRTQGHPGRAYLTADMPDVPTVDDARRSLANQTGFLISAIRHSIPAAARPELFRTK